MRSTPRDPDLLGGARAPRRSLRRRCPSTLAALALPAALAAAAPASADPGFSLHAEGAVAHMAGDPLQQFGWGASGLIAPGLDVVPKLGLELPIGLMGFARGASRAEVDVPSTGGLAFLIMPGVSLRPFAGPRPSWGDVLWIGGGGGVGFTGGLACPSFDLRVGADFRVGPVAMGPFAGYVQLVNTHRAANPDDARVLMAGIHWTIVRPRAPSPRAEAGAKDPAVAVDAPQDEDGPALVRERCPGNPDTPEAYAVDHACPAEPAPPAEAPVVARAAAVEGRLLFVFHRAQIVPESRGELDAFATLLEAHPEYARVRIEGHADESGDPVYNLLLSERRALTVKAALVRAGVDEGRLSVAFYGDKRPLSRGHGEQARRENRRVELHVVERRAAAPPAPATPLRTADKSGQGGSRE